MNKKIQIQHLLKLNRVSKEIYLGNLIYSNTTLVKVKYFNTAMGISGSINSNTKLVKVKFLY